MHSAINRLSARLLASCCLGLFVFAGVRPSFSQDGGAAAPTITSSLSQKGGVGRSFEYQITSTPSASTYRVAGLPPGLSLDSATGLISGTLRAAGSFDVALTAQTTSGDANATLRMTVRPPEFVGSFPTNLQIGDALTAHFGASVPPTGYSATGLPPGVKLDEATGQVSGVVEISGSYLVTLTTHTAYGDATGQFNLLVAPRINSATPVATLPFLPADANSGAMVADPRRPRVYLWTYAALVVVDTQSLEVVKTFAMPEAVADLSLSADGNKLWIAYAWRSFSYFPYIGSIDLETLTVLPDMVFDFKPVQVREGLGGWLYVLDGNRSVRQVDSATGVSQPPFTQGVWDSSIEISPDRRTLFMADDWVAAPGGGSHLSRFDISDSSPVLLQRVNTRGQDISNLAVSQNGEYLAVVTSTGGLSLLAPADLTKVFANIPGATSGPLAFSADSTQLFQINNGASSIRVFNPANAQLVRTIELEVAAHNAALLADAANSYLFLAGWRYAGTSLVEVYDIGAPSSSSPPRTLLNVSTRMRTQTGDGALIGGFIIQGKEAKRIVLRAIGPSLPLNGKLADPLLQLYDSAGVLLAENDNWNAHRADVLATRIPPADEHEAALAVTLEAGSYTVAVRSANAASGVALVEVYDLNSRSDSKLANISTRGRVEAGDNVMIGGFIIGGQDESTAVVVRAIGPSLSNAGLVGTLADPMLAVHDGNGALLAQNDDWRVVPEAELINSGLAPTDERESALLLHLQPGAYTAIVRGKDNRTGLGLVEIYNLDANQAREAGERTRPVLSPGGR